MDNQWLIVIGIIIITLLLAKAFQYLSPDIKKARPSLGIPGYRVFYADHRSAGDNDDIHSELLLSTKYKLQGKPDYIFVNSMGSFVPVELKSGTIGDSPVPHDGDLMQLAAYFLIIEDVYAKRPKYGKLIYSDKMFIIKNNRRLRRTLFSILSDMRDMLDTGEQEAFPGFMKCKHCVCRDTVCEYCE